VIGAPALVPRNGFEDGGLITHHLFVARSIVRDVGRAFLYETLRDDRFRSFARGHASGTTVLGLRTSDCESYRVLLPPPLLRHAFEEAARPLLTLSERLQDATELLKTTRDLLLPRLVSGDVDVDEVDIAFEEEYG
jgi:type I restriction enzyme, S subunit